MGAFVKRDPIAIIVVAMAISLMLVFGIHRARQSPAKSSDTGNSLKGKVAPDFALTSLDGKTIHLSDYRGKAVLLNFWATWCEPCKIEMPWFVDLQQQVGPQGLQILGVDMDEASPSEYMVSNKIPLLTESWAAAKPRITARMGPTQGVQPKAKANPITKAPQKVLPPFTW